MQEMLVFNFFILLYYVHIVCTIVDLFVDYVNMVYICWFICSIMTSDYRLSVCTIVDLFCLSCEHGVQLLIYYVNRVLPETTISGLREEVDNQLGSDTVPRDYVFLKSVGRCLTRVSVIMNAYIYVCAF